MNMITLELKTHPDVLFAYTNHNIDLILRVENKDEISWVEADVSIPNKISLSPTNSLDKGRVRVGIVNKDESMEKGVKLYASPYTNPQMYRCKIILYAYNKDGTIETRIEKAMDVRCEPKKKEVI